MRYIMTYFTEFRRNAVKEIAAADSEVVCKSLTWETTVVNTKMQKKVFSKRLTESQPVFIRHIMPVDEICELSEHKREDLDLILDRVKKICHLPKGASFSVQSRVVDGKGDYNSKDIEIFLGEYYEDQGCEPVFSDECIINYDIQVISVFIKDSTCYIGCSTAQDNLNLQCNEYRVLGKQPPVISRAENKLKEAISKFGITIKEDGYALDVGAAPGGWTKVLADYGCHVCAVDPGELDDRLKGYKNIIHYKKRIEEMVFDRPFNLMTCDMNVDALIAAKMMCSLRSRLADNGCCIITLKLPFKDEEERIRRSLDILKDKFQILGVKNLTHNRREVTVYMQSKAQSNNFFKIVNITP